MVRGWLFNTPQDAAATEGPDGTTRSSPHDVSLRDGASVHLAAADTPPAPHASLMQSLSRRWGTRDKQAQDPLRILTLGSCRVHNPIQAAAQEGSVEAVYGELGLLYSYYFHTARANLQFLAMLLGDKEIPPAAWPWIFFQGRYRPPNVAHPNGVRALIGQIDAILIEVCASGEIVSGDLLLHEQEILRSFVELGGPAARAWWQALTQQRDPAALFDAALAEVIANGHAPQLASLELLRHARSHTTTQAEISEGLRDLVAYSGKPVFVVTHTAALGSDGQPIAKRQAFIDTVLAACELAGVKAYEPGKLVEEFGQASVFDKDGTDTAHFHPSFQAAAGQRMSAFVAHNLALHRAQTASQPGPLAPGFSRFAGSANSEPALLMANAISKALTVVDLSALESDIVGILRNRIANLGADGSGLGSYYATRLEIGQAFSAADHVLLQTLASGYHEFSEIVEAGAGYGQVALALALSGRNVIAIEVSRSRFDCMTGLKTALQVKYPALARNALLVHGAWPQILDGHDSTQSLFIAADFVFTGPPDVEARAIAGLKRHKGAIIDGVHFVHTRPQRLQREALYNAIQRAGLTRPLPVHHQDATGNSEFVFTRNL